MGAWGTAIKSNDTSSDIYNSFFDLYNEGEVPLAIAEKLIKQNKGIIDSPEDANNFWFALALALWETKSLTGEIYQRVRETIESGQDLLIWKELDASENDIRKRKAVLDKFLEQVSTEKPKAKARKKKVHREPIFEKGTCLCFKLANGNYGGAVVLEADKRTGQGYNLVVTTRLNQPEKPTMLQFEKAEALMLSFANWKNKLYAVWYSPARFQKECSNVFEIVGRVPVEVNYSPDDSEFSFSGSWHHITEPILEQLQHEQGKGATKPFPMIRLTKRKKWWQF